MLIAVRRWLTFVDEVEATGGGPPLRKSAVVAVVVNPHAGAGHVADLAPMIAASVALGHEFGARAAELTSAHGVQSYGKGGIVGLAGEQEHANAMLTTAFANPVRDAIGGGAAWIASFTKRAAPCTAIDVPLAHKDALYVRSHYDGMTLMLPDAPMPDEIALIMCFASRGRIGARVGGLSADAIQGEDGLR